MAIEIGTAVVNIIPSARGLQANLARELAPIPGIAARQGSQAGTALGVGLVSRFRNEAKGLGKELQSSLSGFGLGAGIGGALITKEAVSAASDLAESQSKVNVVFKSGAADVEKWSESAATGLGISKQGALEAAGTFGNFLISMGLVPKEAQKMSTSLVGLASDLASFNNTSPEEALLAIRSGLAGEIEPLRRYGVALSAARIEQAAAAQGINKTSAEMSAAEKATLSYGIILDDTALAQGDFARTSDGLANTQRILAAKLKDAEAQLGSALIPTLLTGAKAATTLGHGLAVVNDATDGWVGTLGGAAVAGGAVFLITNKLASVAQGLLGTFTAQTATTGALTAAQAANATVASADAVAQGELAVASGTAAAAMEGEAASASILGTALKGTLAPGLAAVAVGFLGGKKLGDEINNMLSGTKPNVDELTASFIGLSKGADLAGIDANVKKFAADLKGQIGRDAINPIKGLRAIFDSNAHQSKDDVEALNAALKSVLQTEGVDKTTLAYGRFQQKFAAAGGDIQRLAGDMEPFFAALDLAQAKELDTSETTKELTANFQNLGNVFAKEAAPLTISDQFEAAQNALDDLNQVKLDAAGQGQKSIDAARSEERARESLTDAYDAEGKASASLLEAKRNLAEFDSATDRRIRDLERTQIAARVVTTPEEARQKEIDLLKFDEDAKDRREQLQKQVASAEDGVATAADRTADAQRGVSEAATARRQVQVEAAGAIEGAERRAEEAILAAGDAVLKAKDAQLIGNTAVGLYLQLLGELGVQVDPNSTLSKNVTTFLDRLSQIALIKASLGPAGFVGPQGPVSADQFKPAPPAGPVGPPAKPSVQITNNNTFNGSDTPTLHELDVLNRKQAIRLSASRVLT